jgi:excisionase family DNA binding protein
MQDEKMLTVVEVAERMRVNEKTVRNWIASGELLAFPIGKRGYRISESDFRSFVDARKKRLQKQTEDGDPQPP